MNKKSRLNITIFGIGAMGTLFGSKLDSLSSVTLVGNWRQQVEAIRQKGLKVTHPDGSRGCHYLNVTNDLNQVSPADIALILVKSYQTDRAARQAATILRPGGLVITLQNGLGNLEKLVETVGSERATLGITAQGATVAAPGRLQHAGEGPTHLALLPGKEKQLQQVGDLFNAAGLPTTLVDSADSLVWGKLSINAAINPLTALLEMPNGALSKDKTLRQIMAAAANEVAEVAARQGIKLPFPNAACRAIEVSRATAGNRSSMLQDLSRGAPTEIEAISGAIVRLGQQLGVPTPVNKRLLQLVRNKESQRFRLNVKRLKVEKAISPIC